MSFARFALLGAALCAFAAPLRANDSEAAIALGGIELVQNDAISMDSEDLYISKSEVRVRYVYTNHTDKDAELTIAFPLPPLRAADEAIYGDQAIPDFSTLDFHTEVDGKPVKLGMERRAEVDGRDVTQRIAALGWPLDWIDGSGEEPAFVRALGKAERDGFVAEGLLRRSEGTDGAVFPAWDVTTLITRKQVFPAHASVVVTHRYAPLIGGSVGGLLEPQWRDEYPEHQQHYCVDKPFLAAFDRQRTRREREMPDMISHSETWIGYVLSSGRNWKGPIGQFRLVVDKGRPENLVSFCMNGVKKISPTQFEVRRTNFEPEGDLDILIVEWPRAE